MLIIKLDATLLPHFFKKKNQFFFFNNFFFLLLSSGAPSGNIRTAKENARTRTKKGKKRGNAGKIDA